LTESFFRQVDETVFESTQNTAGPWDPKFQHGGPPAALLGRAVERIGGRDDVQVARITLEILRPVPVARLEVAARIARPGKNVELVEASLAHEGDEVVIARAWRIRTSELAIDPPNVAAPSRGPEESEPNAAWSTGWEGYLDAVEWRFASGSFLEPGPARAWIRMRVPLLPDEEPSPLTRVLVVADSGSGISAQLDWNKWLFINTDLTVALHRPPDGEWVLLDAATTLQPHGIGLAATEISDRSGLIGRGQQTLYIAERR
jgi:Thioesterase-like superfamily